MKVVGGSRTVDLSKKLTVEMTLQELAVMTVGLGAIGMEQYNDNVANVVKAEFEDGIKIKPRLGEEGDYAYQMYSAIHDILIDEGVAE